MINVQHLDFYYGNTQALYDVSVELPQGSITGLIGPNGAGKSTLMRCMAGLEIPTSGDVLLDGLPILDNPRDSFSKLGYLPDFFWFAGWFERDPVLNVCRQIPRYS